MNAKDRRKDRRRHHKLLEREADLKKQLRAVTARLQLFEQASWWERLGRVFG